jgi:hypothetical protein
MMAVTISSASRPGEVPQGPKAPPLACTIRSGATCELGKVPIISVEITNWTGADIYLVGSLDGSDLRWRYPFCYFEVIGPDGKSVQERVGRCGNMNALREKDFVKVPPGGKFNPYQKIDDSGFFPSSQLTPAMFRGEGEYRIRFIYSTGKAEPKYWLADAHGNSAAMLRTGGSTENLVKLLALVPKTTVSSNEITIKVVNAKK